MVSDSLEQALRNLPSVATLIKDRGYRQVWRLAHGGRPYYVKFYRRGGVRDEWRRFFRGSPAANEFYRLQRLQKANISAPRAIAFLLGMNLTGRNGVTLKGDAVVLEAIEPSIPLDQMLGERELNGEPVPEHRCLALQVIELVRQLGQAGLGHDDLHLGNFLLRDGKVYLIDAYAVRKGGLRQADVLQLGASVSRFATRTDIVRAWRALGCGSRPPERNPVGVKVWHDLLNRAGRSNRYFGRVQIGKWRGTFFRQTNFPRRWSQASRLRIAGSDWEAAWPELLSRLESDTLPVLKRSRSGDVLRTSIKLGGCELDVVIKRPWRRYWYRYFNEIPRGPRSRRAWFKAWNLVVRNLPTAWPVAFFEKRTLGYVTEAIFISEHIPGPTLWTVKLDEMPADQRERLFRRAGHILRQIERFGFSHFDAKASNWIVRSDAALGPSPVLIDVDGVRRRNWVTLGIRRLLRSLEEKPQYAPADSLALCQGYAPFNRVLLGEDEAEQGDPPGNNGHVQPDVTADPIQHATEPNPGH